MADLVRNFIGGKWVEARTGETFNSLNPATEELVAPVVKSGMEDVAAAVDAASRAYDGWRLMPAPRRGEILYRIGQLLMERKEALAQLMTQEMGKVIAEARGDVQEAIDMAFFMGGGRDERNNPFVLPGIVIRTTPTDHFPIAQARLERYHNGNWVYFGSIVHIG